MPKMQTWEDPDTREMQSHRDRSSPGGLKDRKEAVWDECRAEAETDLVEG